MDSIVCKNQSFKLNLSETVFIAVTSAAFGLAFWSWTFVYAFFSPLLKTLGLSFILSGFWMSSAVFAPYVIRKPGLAIFASTLAAFVESLLAKWGITAVLYGFLQGLGAEIVFALFLYKNWHPSLVYLASLSAAFFGYVFQYYHSDFSLLSNSVIAIQILTSLVSSLILSGFFVLKLVKKLLPTGLLDEFAIR